jgi:choline dehydrogenase-like flavoprotein
LDITNITRAGGYVKIKSTNPFDAPLINPNFLTTQVDIQSIREGVRAVLQFAGAPAWSDYITGRYGDKFIAANDDASIDEYIRSITTTIFHPASTAMLTKATDSWGVVNPDFRVKGTTGLRVVDASVFVRLLSCIYTELRLISLVFTALPAQLPSPGPSLPPL